jgi:hypothetical protein
MSRFTPNSKSERATSLRSIADWIPKGLLPAPLLYPVAPRLRQFYSPHPKHIGIAGDPPLCRACAFLLSQPHSVVQLGKATTLNGERLRKSAGLGCYICSILYNAEWNPVGMWGSNTPSMKRMKDITTGKEPTEIIYNIARTGEEIQSGCFHLEVVVNMEKLWLGLKWPLNRLDIWRLSLKLLPEKGNSWVSTMHGQIRTNPSIGVEEMEPRTLSTATSPEAAAALGRAWIKNRQKNHSTTCRVAKSANWQPTRLIQVRNIGRDCQAHLCLSTSLPRDIRYITLSHCWGRLEIFKLLLSNIDDLKRSIPLHRLTPLFRDALDITQRIGVEYIWIDSLCIIQDSKEDWAQESARMGEVYKNAWCNIAATGFKDGQAGLYVQRDPALIYPRKFSFDIRDAIGIETPTPDQSDRPSARNYYCMEDTLYSDITMSPLAQRAWVYQERLLSQRIIHFGSRQILWECKTLEACETFPHGMPGPLRKGFKGKTQVDKCVNLASDLERGALSEEETRRVSMMDDPSQTVWRTIKEGYNDKNLTFHTDKVIALGGLAREIQRVSHDTFIAGFWRRNLLQELMWLCPYTDTNDIIGRQRPTSYQAPSWSWLSINVGVHDLELTGSIPLAKIIDHSVTHPSRDSPGDSSEFDQITDGYIRIRGRLMRACFVAKDRELRAVQNQLNQIRLQSSSHNHLIALFALMPDIYNSFSSMSGSKTFPILDSIGREFYLLPIAEIAPIADLAPIAELAGIRVGLILKHTGTRGQYKRIGVWTQGVDAKVKRSDEIYRAVGSHVPLLDELDYEDLEEQGECTVKII